MLKILADQNRTLAALAVNGDIALAPLARERERIKGFINSSAKTASATASRSAALEENFRLLPQFLRELVPTMNSLGDFSEAFLPSAQALGGAATDINTFVTGTPEFAAGRLQGADDARRRAPRRPGPALEQSLPFVKDLGSLASQAKPAADEPVGAAALAPVRGRDQPPAERRLLPRRRHQRLRPVRPLRPRAPRADDLHDVRDRRTS